MSNLRHNRGQTFVAFLISAILVFAALWVFLNKQYVSDQIRVWQYSPSKQVEAINNRVGFTNEGKFIFYATSPKISAQGDFNDACPRHETASPILGCYTSQDKIFIFNVQNSELDGIQEVTAAHEMLHAAWYRMNDNEKNRVGALLEEAYNALKDDALKQRMAYYQRTEPTEFLNELHSILGTETASLSSELEDHYKQFFTDRQNVVELHRKYSEAFDKLYGRVNELTPQLASLSEKITKDVEQYRLDEATLSKDISSFNQRATTGNFSSIGQFNTERAALVTRSNKLDSQREAINDSINTYNALTAEYNEIAQKIEGLNKSIDSYKSLEKGPSVQ